MITDEELLLLKKTAENYRGRTFFSVFDAQGNPCLVHALNLHRPILGKTLDSSVTDLRSLLGVGWIFYSRLEILEKINAEIERRSHANAR